MQPVFQYSQGVAEGSEFRSWEVSGPEGSADEVVSGSCPEGPRFRSWAGCCPESAANAARQPTDLQGRFSLRGFPSLGRKLASARQTAKKYKLVIQLTDRHFNVKNI